MLPNNALKTSNKNRTVNLVSSVYLAPMNKFRFPAIYSNRLYLIADGKEIFSVSDAIFSGMLWCVSFTITLSIILKSISRSELIHFFPSLMDLKRKSAILRANNLPAFKSTYVGKKGKSEIFYSGFIFILIWQDFLAWLPGSHQPGLPTFINT